MLNSAKKIKMHCFSVDAIIQKILYFNLLVKKAILANDQKKWQVNSFEFSVWSSFWKVFKNVIDCLKNVQPKLIYAITFAWKVQYFLLDCCFAQLLCLKLPKIFWPTLNTVKPWLSVLIRTSVNSPDNRESG